MIRIFTCALVALALLVPASASAATAQTSRSRAWICTIGGALVAAGVGKATAPVTGTLAGGAFTAGCNLGTTYNATLISGLPPTTRCWLEWHKRRYRLAHWHPPMSLKAIRYYSVRVCRV
jgi:hypothetical protein